MRIGKSVVSHFLATVVASLAGFLTTFAIARILGADVLGSYALVQSIIVFMTVPSIGIFKASTKYISEGENVGSYVAITLAMSAISFVVLVVALLSLDTYVADYVGADVATLIALLVVSMIASETVGAIMKGQKLVARFGWLTTTEKILRAGLQIGLIVVGYKLSGLLVGHAFSLLVLTGLAMYVLDVPLSMPEPSEVREFLSFARFSWVGGLKSKTFGWMDTLVLGFFVSSSYIGVYEVAWTLSSFLVLASNSIRNVVFPELSELSGQRQHQEINDLLAESIQYTGLIIIPGFFGALVIGPRILKIYSPEFVVGGTVLTVLILAQAFDAYGRQFVDVLNAIDRPDAAYRINLAFTVLNLALNVVLIYLFGWIGAAVATLLSGLVTLVLGYRYLSNTLQTIRVPYTEISKQILAAATMTPAVYTVSILLPPNHYSTIALVFGGAAIYGAILLTISGSTRRKAGALVSDLRA